MEPVVDGDEDHLLLNESSHSVEILRAEGESSAVYPEHDGSVDGSEVGGEDVESKTIL